MELLCSAVCGLLTVLFVYFCYAGSGDAFAYFDNVVYVFALFMLVLVLVGVSLLASFVVFCAYVDYCAAGLSDCYSIV